jgi:hypothetical protein
VPPQRLNGFQVDICTQQATKPWMATCETCEDGLDNFGGVLSRAAAYPYFHNFIISVQFWPNVSPTTPKAYVRMIDAHVTKPRSCHRVGCRNGVGVFPSAGKCPNWDPAGVRSAEAWHGLREPGTLNSEGEPRETESRSPPSIHGA